VPIEFITDLDDERLADFRNVPDAELLRDRGLFVGERRLIVRRPLAARRGAIDPINVATATAVVLYEFQA
jgi:hypothetical protein